VEVEVGVRQANCCWFIVTASASTASEQGKKTSSSSLQDSIPKKLMTSLPPERCILPSEQKKVNDQLGAV
jgi:predicted adenine nucleotide alpha hydrolase (AANH) superfamily ATPase